MRGGLRQTMVSNSMTKQAMMVHESRCAMSSMSARLVRAFLLSLIGVSGALAQSATSQGVFSEEQAKRGAVAYSANCAGCHGADLHSTDREVPELTGPPFKDGWVGKTIFEKFEAAREMPPREERSLPDQMYLDIITFILRFNKVPVGSNELKPDVQMLKQIKIDNPT
jgi:mono/diheme cytochrome c family protein